MNRGYLSKAVQVVNRQHQHTKTGEEKFNNLVSKYIVDSDRQTELIVTQEMVNEAKKIVYDMVFCRRVLKKMKDGKGNGIDFIRTEMMKYMVEIHAEVHEMSTDAMKLNSFLVWLTNETFQNKFMTAVSEMLI